MCGGGRWLSFEEYVYGTPHHELTFIAKTIITPVMRRKRYCLKNHEHHRAEDLSPIIFMDSLSLVSFSSTSSWRSGVERMRWRGGERREEEGKREWEGEGKEGEGRGEGGRGGQGRRGEDRGAYECQSYNYASMHASTDTMSM